MSRSSKRSVADADQEQPARLVRPPAGWHVQGEHHGVAEQPVPDRGEVHPERRLDLAPGVPEPSRPVGREPVSHGGELAQALRQGRGEELARMAAQVLDRQRHPGVGGDEPEELIGRARAPGRSGETDEQDSDQAGEGSRPGHQFSSRDRFRMRRRLPGRVRDAQAPLGASEPSAWSPTGGVPSRKPKARRAEPERGRTPALTRSSTLCSTPDTGRTRTGLENVADGRRTDAESKTWRPIRAAGAEACRARSQPAEVASASESVSGRGGADATSGAGDGPGSAPPPRSGRRFARKTASNKDAARASGIDQARNTVARDDGAGLRDVQACEEPVREPFRDGRRWSPGHERMPERPVAHGEGPAGRALRRVRLQGESLGLRGFPSRVEPVVPRPIEVPAIHRLRLLVSDRRRGGTGPGERPISNGLPGGSGDRPARHAPGGARS